MISKKLLKIDDLKLNKNICVIGSSKILLKQKNGNLINKFNDVVRFNRSKVEGYKMFVGNKTTLRILNNHVFMNIKIWKQSYKEQFFAKNLKKNRILIISPSKIEKDTFKKNMTNHNKYYFLSSKQILIQSLIYFKFDLKIFIKILKIFLSRLTFSVGLTFVMYLIMLNFRPTLFGFDLKENMKNRSHYFEKAGKPGKRHNLELEHKILKELQRRNLLYINH